MKITIGYNEFNNSANTLKEEFTKAGFEVLMFEDYFEITLTNKNDLLEFYKIIVNN